MQPDPLTPEPARDPEPAEPRRLADAIFSNDLGPALLLRLEDLRRQFATAESDPARRLRLWLRRSELQAARYLLKLLRHPGRSFSPQTLYGSTAARRQAYLPAETGNPRRQLLLEADLRYCDARTLREVRARIKKLETALAETKSHQPGRLALKRELAALYAYLKDCVAPGGQLRPFPVNRAKTARAVRESFRRLLGKLAGDDPQLHSYVLARLRRGNRYAWKRENVQGPG